MTSIERAARTIRSAQRISIVIHQKPDGDAIGSAVALQGALTQEKTVEIVSSSDIPPVFFQVTGLIPVSKKIDPASDLIIVVDCSEMHRTGFTVELRSKKRGDRSILLIDHHTISNLDRYATITIRDETACSTAEIVYRLLRELRFPITPAISSALLLGIYTDTGGFHHANTTSLTLQTASQLIRKGGDLARITQAFSHQRTIKQVRLWGAILSSVLINRFGIAIAKVEQETLKTTGAKTDDIAGLANILCLLEKARAAAVLVETEEGWRVSMRTRYSTVNLKKLATYFGGSGTKKAAGFLATNRLFSGKIDKV